MFDEYFTAESFLNLLVDPDDTHIFIVNVTFEPGCRNNWYIRHALAGITYSDCVVAKAGIRKKVGGGELKPRMAGSGW